MKNTIVFGILALSALSSCTMHPPSPPSKEEREREFVHCFREEMQTTDEQLKILQEKIFKNTSAVEAVAKDMGKSTDELEQGLESETAEAVLLERFHKVGELKAKMAEDHFRRMLMLRSILTPQQRAKFLVCKRKMGPAVLPHE